MRRQPSRITLQGALPLAHALAMRLESGRDIERSKRLLEINLGCFAPDLAGRAHVLCGPADFGACEFGVTGKMVTTEQPDTRRLR